MQCRICASGAVPFGSIQVLGKYQVAYFRCTECGFVQTETPYWLGEAYSEAIAKQDVGIMGRNELNALLTSSLLAMSFPTVERAIDFGGGHGVFVRMMRDRGYNFFWRDLYAANVFARGFEYDRTVRYDFLTAFEVLEHFIDPMAEIESLMASADNVFVSTLTIPEPTPALADWWYYVPSSGQHVSLYTKKTLQYIAQRFNRHLESNGAYHLFTTAPSGSLRFRLAMNAKCAKVIGHVTRRPSLVPTDFERFARLSGA